jgi:hypothetical protein
MKLQVSRLSNKKRIEMKEEEEGKRTKNKSVHYMMMQSGYRRAREEKKITSCLAEAQK